MIISRTPYRISFFGGGTDFPEWFNDNGGAVLSTTIDKYCHIFCRPLPQFFEHKYRIVYSEIELTKNIDEIKHPSVRECFRFLNQKEGVEIHHDGDLPARSGLGSSSAFTVGLLNVLMALKGRVIDKKSLSRDAILIDRELIKEIGGHQDEISCSYGGFNKIIFHPSNGFSVSPIIVKPRVIDELERGLCLFFTGKSRTAEAIEKSKLEILDKKKTELNNIMQLTLEAEKLLTSSSFTLTRFGNLLHETWLLKKCLSSQVSTPEIDSIYRTATKAGIYGGKILGAGGGGFILFCIEPYMRQKLVEAMYPLVHVPFKFEREGSKIALYQPEGS